MFPAVIFQFIQQLVLLIVLIVAVLLLLKFALVEWRAAKGLKNPTYDMYYCELSPIMSAIDTRDGYHVEAIMYNGHNAGDIADWINETNYHKADHFLNSILDNKPLAVAGQYLILKDGTIEVIDAEEFDVEYVIESWRSGSISHLLEVGGVKNQVTYNR